MKTVRWTSKRHDPGGSRQHTASRRPRLFRKPLGEKRERECRAEAPCRSNPDSSCSQSMTCPRSCTLFPVPGLRSQWRTRPHSCTAFLVPRSAPLDLCPHPTRNAHGSFSSLPSTPRQAPARRPHVLIRRGAQPRHSASVLAKAAAAGFCVGRGAETKLGAGSQRVCVAMHCCNGTIVPGTASTVAAGGCRCGRYDEQSLFGAGWEKKWLYARASSVCGFSTVVSRVDVENGGERAAGACTTRTAKSGGACLLCILVQGAEGAWHDDSVQLGRSAQHCVATSACCASTAQSQRLPRSRRCDLRQLQRRLVGNWISPATSGPRGCLLLCWAGQAVAHALVGRYRVRAKQNPRFGFGFG